MKHIIWMSLLIMGFVASSALTVQGAPLTHNSHLLSHTCFPPLPDPNSGKPPIELTAFPPLPDPNSGKPPMALTAFPPLPDPNSGKPPIALTSFPPLPDPNSGKPPARS